MTYVDGTGELVAPTGPLRIDNVSIASFAFTPPALHHDLRVALDWSPVRLGLETAEVSVTVRCVMIVDIVDAASGQVLRGGHLVFEQPFTLPYALEGEDEVSARVIVDRCVRVSFSLRITGFPDPVPID